MTFFLLSFVIILPSSDKYNLLNSINNDYKTELFALLEKFNNQKKLTDEELIRIIPKNEGEFDLYYSLTSPKKDKRWNIIYSNIQVYIFKRASASQMVFKSYLGMATLVDGEYAEAYFERLDFLIGKHTTFFCKIFKNLRPIEKDRLEDFHIEYCK